MPDLVFDSRAAAVPDSAGPSPPLGVSSTDGPMSAGAGSSSFVGAVDTYVVPPDTREAAFLYAHGGAAPAQSSLTARDIADELVGLPASIVDFVSVTLDRICDHPTKDKLLKITQRLFRTHGAYVHSREQERKLRDREMLLVNQVRAAVTSNITLTSENQMLRRALMRMARAHAVAAGLGRPAASSRGKR
eukprot:c48180_g1_i1.p2 GENE.c48180_g1_i1~~c48180_g1_i1.p2  ORF type:complete len:190 (-),score=28.29 c48180_g1_i1:35-604(-)